MNNWCGIGRLTADPELRYSQANNAVVSFTVAVQRNYKNKQGEYDADFIRCKAFGNRAEMINEKFNKGNMIAIEGAIQTSKSEVNGQTKYYTDIIVGSVTFVEKKKADDGYSNDDYGGDDIPF